MAGKQIFGVIEFYMEILLKVILKITLLSNQKPEFPNQIVHCTESSSSKTPFFVFSGHQLLMRVYGFSN